LLIKPYKSHSIVLVLAGVTISTVVIYFGHAYTKKSISIFALIDDLLSTAGGVAEMSDFSPYINPYVGLVISCVTRGALLMIACNINVPCGVFLPLFLSGGYIGRLWGKLLHSALAEISVPSYALIGGCAFCAGVTHTVSVAVVLAELTGNWD